MSAQELMPHDTAAERVLLCGAMREPDAVFPVLHAMEFDAGAFYCHHHALVYRALWCDWNHFRRVGPYTLFVRLSRTGELADLGLRPAAWLCELWAELATADEAVEAGEVVLWMSDRRDAIHLANESLRAARDGHMSPRPRLRVFREAVAV